MDNISINDHCLIATNAKIIETSWLWHRRLWYASTHQISKLIKRNLVKKVLILNFKNDYVYNACQLGKLTRKTLKVKNLVSTSRSLELLHMNLFGPTRTTSLGEKKYGLVIVDDYSRYSWVLFLTHKDETFSAFTKLFERVSN